MALSPVEILLFERDEVDVFFRVRYLRYCIPGQPAAQCFFFPLSVWALRREMRRFRLRFRNIKVLVKECV